MEYKISRLGKIKSNLFITNAPAVNNVERENTMIKNIDEDQGALKTRI
ncbi:hypothetical protein GNIT_2593 [Glaciecola nitratireducens FR1064]|uniref:Uncharacterized protein n=1 Tax=Glaciecola nitratireducens (strain JCM 12485 / KCTC 12276 / FR1064) TaxID=1085623 RepID=G4QI76_GLANF|nr:hypothetical protein GNIT_2593 [Glaciecola nitratireducens FR1064]